MRKAPSRPRRSTAAALRTISSRRSCARLPLLFSRPGMGRSSLTSESKSTPDRRRARRRRVLDERRTRREVREHILPRGDVMNRQPVDTAAPVVGEARPPRGFVARRLLHRFAHADRELLRAEARRAAYVLVLALEPWPPELRIPDVMPGAQPVAAVPGRRHGWRITLGQPSIVHEGRRVQHDAAYAVSQPMRELH